MLDTLCIRHLTMSGWNSVSSPTWNTSLDAFLGDASHCSSASLTCILRMMRAKSFSFFGLIFVFLTFATAVGAWLAPESKGTPTGDTSAD